MENILNLFSLLGVTDLLFCEDFIDETGYILGFLVLCFLIHLCIGIFFASLSMRRNLSHLRDLIELKFVLVG